MHTVTYTYRFRITEVLRGISAFDLYNSKLCTSFNKLPSVHAIPIYSQHKRYESTWSREKMGLRIRWKYTSYKQFEVTRELKKVANMVPAVNSQANSPGSDSSLPISSFQGFRTSIVNHLPKGVDGEDRLKSISRSLEAVMSGQVLACHVKDPQMMISQSQSSAAVEFLNLTLFMMSNNFLELNTDVGMEIYDWIIEGRLGPDFLDYLLSIAGPTTEALAEHLFALAIEEEDDDTVKEILKISGLDPNEPRCFTKRAHPITPLQNACELCSPQLVQVLIDAGADVNRTPSNTMSPLTIAVRHTGEEDDYWGGGGYLEDSGIVQVLLDNDAIVNPGPDESPLAAAAANCYPELVSVLLSKGADPNVLDKALDKTPLMGAVLSRKGDVSTVISIVRDLLEAGADVHSTSHSENKDVRSTVLQNALCQYSVELIELLLEFGACVTEPALLDAIEHEELDIIELFLNSGARVTDEVVEKSAKNGNFEILLILLESTEGSLKERARSMAFVQAIRLGRKDVIDTLSTSPIELQASETLSAAIEAVARKGDIFMLRFLLDDKSPYLESVVESMGCSLGEAIYAGQSEIIEILLAAGVDVNAWNSHRETTPLLEAIRRKNAYLSQKLLDTGAAVNMKNPRHDKVLSVLSEVVAWGHCHLVQAIIEAGAEINAFSRAVGNTALSQAVCRRDLASFQLLIDAGADINPPAVVSSEHTPLTEAVRNSDIDMVQHLLGLGAEVNDRLLIVAVSKSLKLMKILLAAKISRYQRFPRGFGSRALQKAIVTLNLDMVEVLLGSGIDSNVILRTPQFRHGDREYSLLTSREESAFGTAVRCDKTMDLWMAHTLLLNGANPNGIVSERPVETALLVAIRQRSLSLVQTLIASGADVDPKLSRGVSRTPLQLAVELGNLDIMETLLNHGADVNAPLCDQRGATALQFVAINGHLGIASLLLQKGADVNASPAKVGGRTALEGAAEHGRIDMLQFLLNSGARVIGRGSQQYERARKFASENCHYAARRLLESHHAQLLEAQANGDLIDLDDGNVEGMALQD